MKIKENFWVGLVLVSTFLTVLIICSLVNSQINFFVDYQEYYEQKIVSQYMNGLSNEDNQLIDAIEYSTSTTGSLTFDLPLYNDETTVSLVYPEKGFEGVTTISGRMFAPDESAFSVVIGKDVLKTLSNSEKKSNAIEIYGQTFSISGVLANSPFNNHILVNAHAAMSNPRIVSNIVQVISQADTFEHAHEQLITLTAQPDINPSYVGDRTEFSDDYGIGSYTTAFSQYRVLFIQLFVVVCLSLGIHYYQRFDAWRLEFGIRKLVGASNFQLVLDTFKKFFALTASSFLIACTLYFVIRALFNQRLSFSLNASVLAVGQVMLLFGSLLLCLFIVSFVYVRKVTVVDILVEADE